MFGRKLMSKTGQNEMKVEKRRMIENYLSCFLSFILLCRWCIIEPRLKYITMLTAFFFFCIFCIFCGAVVLLVINYSICVCWLCPWPFQHFSYQHVTVSHWFSAETYYHWSKHSDIFLTWLLFCSFRTIHTWVMCWWVSVATPELLTLNQTASTSNCVHHSNIQ